jgi:hypothetical protein
MTNTTHDADRGAHDYADKEARRVSRKVSKAVQYTVSDKAAKELKQVAYRLAYDEAYGPVYRDLLKHEIESRVLDKVREAFVRFNAESEAKHDAWRQQQRRDAVHVTTFEENGELVRQATEADEQDRARLERFAALSKRADALGLDIVNDGYAAVPDGDSLDALETQIAEIEQERAS